jgi:hypothetical protein
MKYRVDIRRGFSSSEYAHLLVEADDANEALAKALTASYTNVLDDLDIYLEWKEDADEFRESRRELSTIDENGKAHFIENTQ